MNTPKPGRDWHRADVMAALRKKGWTMQGLALAHHYSRSAVSNTLNDPWPAVEKLIADTLGTTPEKIWPSRYNPDGTPRHGIPTSKLPPRPRHRPMPRRSSPATRS